jgi:uncharacterized protein
MHFAREDVSGGFAIRAYSASGIRVGDIEYTRSLILSAAGVIADWRPRSTTELEPGDFAAVLQLDPDILLLGTGSELRFPRPALTGQLLQSGIGVEVMDTAAACRTYNILLSEQRRVVAALLLD